ncbi:MAG: hypothetical protein ABEJ83_00135 [Candidatus Nanohaloarchaea archaeon]
MIQNSELLSEIEDADLDETLFEELLEEHDGIRKAFNRKDYEKTLNKTGKFVETTFQILQEIKDGEHDARPSFNDVKGELEDEEKGEYPESIRKIMPRVAKSMYTFRSERGGSHKVEIDHQYIDAHFNVQAARWIVAELLRIYGDGDLEVEELESQVQNIATRSLPLVEEFEDGDIVILHQDASIEQETMMVLYHFYPERVETEKLMDMMSHQKRNSVSQALRRAEERRVIHRNEDGEKLTERGKQEIEEKYGPELQEDKES